MKHLSTQYFNHNQLKEVAAPTESTDAANKAYVDHGREFLLCFVQPGSGLSSAARQYLLGHGYLHGIVVDVNNYLHYDRSTKKIVFGYNNNQVLTTHLDNADSSVVAFGLSNDSSNGENNIVALYCGEETSRQFDTIRTCAYLQEVENIEGEGGDITVEMTEYLMFLEPVSGSEESAELMSMILGVNDNIGEPYNSVFLSHPEMAWPGAGLYWNYHIDLAALAATPGEAVRVPFRLSWDATNHAYGIECDYTPSEIVKLISKVTEKLVLAHLQEDADATINIGISADFHAINTYVIPLSANAIDASYEYSGIPVNFSENVVSGFIYSPYPPFYEDGYGGTMGMDACYVILSGLVEHVSQGGQEAIDEEGWAIEISRENPFDNDGDYPGVSAYETSQGVYVPNCGSLTVEQAAAVNHILCTLSASYSTPLSSKLLLTKGFNAQSNVDGVTFYAADDENLYVLKGYRDLNAANGPNTYADRWSFTVIPIGGGIIDFSHSDISTYGGYGLSFPSGRNTAHFTTSNNLNLDLRIYSRSDNYIWVTNSGSSEIYVTFSNIEFLDNLISRLFLPEDGISVPAGKVCEIGVIANDNGVYITSRSDLEEVDSVVIYARSNDYSAGFVSITGASAYGVVWLKPGASQTVTLTAEPLAGYVFEKWQESADGSTFTDISGATSATYTLTVGSGGLGAGKYYYKAVFVENV